MSPHILDVTTQLTFYGAYHANRINILIHMICVPILVWSFQVLTAQIPVPSVIPAIHREFNGYLVFDLNWPAIVAGLYILYYLALEPVAAATQILYVPQVTLSLLTATVYAQRPDGIRNAALLHIGSWIAQFLGHGLAEKRAPALIDNLLGAVVLAPFFVHLELLFRAGYRPEFHLHLTNEIGKEVARIRKIKGDKKHL